jgi:SAM-dependent methyltransferase
MEHVTSNRYSSLWFDLFMPLQTDESTQNDLAFLARQLPLPRYRRILDLCCGYGRHTLGLAERGYAVTGVDRDATAIDRARRRAQEACQQISYVLGDMRKMSEMVGEYDAVINMWQSLCYFDEETNAALLRQIQRQLTPGGRFIVDMYNRDYFQRHEGTRRQSIDGVTIESSGFMKGNRWHSILVYSDPSGRRDADHMEWQIFTADEFSAFAAECGFTTRLVCTWSDEDQAVSTESARMQIVLEKTQV